MVTISCSVLLCSFFFGSSHSSQFSPQTIKTVTQWKEQDLGVDLSLNLRFTHQPGLLNS